MEIKEQPTSLLRDGETVWRRTLADRAALLFDGATYYGALREALLQAEHTVFIIGWDIDSRTRIVGRSAAATDGAPETLGQLLSYLVSRRDGLHIYLLPWDYSILFLSERELLPTLALGWKMPDRVHLCLDGTAPIASSHHQKLVVIDDSLAFCGGLDLTVRRWDTTDHRQECPARVDPAGAPYGPYHDLQLAVDGDAARALGEIARARWRAASAEEVPAAAEMRALWPKSVQPDFRDVTVGIARTMPQSLDGPGVDEVERLYLEAIGQAERTIYIENQFLHCDAIAEALAHRAAAQPDLEIVIISNQTSGGWLEGRTMGVGRRRFISILRDGAGADRTRILRSLAGPGDDPQEVHIHAKLQIIDDRLLRVGSSNLNRRSMGLDTECDLAIEACRDAERQRVRDLRDALIAHHLGVPRDALRGAIERHGSVIRALDEMIDRTRALEPIDPSYPPPLLDEEFEAGLANAADPRKPPTHAALAAALELQPHEPRPNVVPVRIALAGLVVIALLLFWFVTPVSDFTDAEALEPYFQQIAGSAWAPVVIPLIFIIASLAFFPVTILIALTGMTLGPVTGFLCAAAGSLGSAAAAFAAGRLLGEKGIRQLMGRRLNRVSRSVADKGVVAVAALRLLPIAPFTMVNLMIGASHIRFGDYMAGTALGMFPGILLMTALGDSLRSAWRNPTVENTVVLGSLAAVWLALTLGFQYLVSKYRKSG